MSNASDKKCHVVAIDGPAGAGKSSVARRVAEALGFTLLDTGALYRAVAFAAKQRDIGWEQDKAVSALAESIAEQDGLRLQPDASAPKGTRVWLNDEDISSFIRERDISLGASHVSALPRVRKALLALQRNQLNHCSLVAEGRDIGTVVFPNAVAKFYLTASLKVRAERRQRELGSIDETGRGSAPLLEMVMAEVRRRDLQDSQRPIAPLRQAEDAVLVDSSTMDVDGVVDFIVTASRAAIKNA